VDAVYIQAKRYAPEIKVSRPAIQQFIGSLTGEGASKGVFVTTSDFSAEAKGYLARVQRIRPVSARFQVFSACQFQGMSSSMRLIL